MSGHDNDLPRQLDYLRRRNEQLAARLIQTDASASALRHELEQKRRGFALLAKLASAALPDDEDALLQALVVDINPTLNMQRTLVLRASDSPGHFRASVLQGYPRAEQEELLGQTLALPAEMLAASEPLMITKASGSELLAPVRARLHLPYFISMPIVIDGSPGAVLITGRTREQQPFMPRLGHGDVETVQAIVALASGILSRRRLAEVERLAHHDALTGLPNLRLANERLAQAMLRQRQDDSIGAVLFVDLDGFKAVNDRLGHDAGDLVLITVARRLQTCVREGDTVARIGGDEFVVLLPALRNRERAARVAEEAVQALSHPIPVGEDAARIGASIGIALFPQHGSDVDSLLKCADTAMYAIKKNGKNGYAFAPD